MPQDSSRENPHNGIPCFMRFPHRYPPPRPRPFSFCASTAAFASRSRWTTESRPSRAAQCSGVSPREPQPEAKPQAEPKRNEGEKSSEKILGISKVEVLESVATQASPGVKKHCVFEDVLMTSSWLKKAMWTRLAVKMLCGNLKRCSISKKTNVRAIGTQQNLKSVPYRRYFVQSRKRPNSYVNWKNVGSSYETCK